MKIFKWLFGPSPGIKQKNKIKQLLSDISVLENKLYILEDQLELQIEARKKAELNLSRQADQHKYHIEQNKLIKIKMNLMVEKQAKVISVVSIILKGADVSDEDRDNICSLLDI